MKKKTAAAKTVKIARARTKPAKRAKRRAVSIEEKIKRIAAGIPQEDWDRVPADLIDNLDHYLYGAQKR